MSGRLRRLAALTGEAGQTCTRCHGTGVEPVAVGGTPPEVRERQRVEDVLADARRKIERERQVRARLPAAVIEAKARDESWPADETRAAG